MFRIPDEELKDPRVQELMRQGYSAGRATIIAQSERDPDKAKAYAELEQALNEMIQTSGIESLITD